MDDSAQFTGILAHEIAHVLRRDPTSSMIHQLGTVFFWKLMIRDQSGWTRQLANLSYSREQEQRADQKAIKLLNGAGWTSTGLESFFNTIEQQGSEADWSIPFLSTHPRPENRIEAMREHTQTRDNPLTESQWRAIQTICQSSKQ